VSADVTYELAGIDADSVLVRAFPDGGRTRCRAAPWTLDGVYEATGGERGRHGAGRVPRGGLTYTITIDAVGDAAASAPRRIVDIPLGRPSFDVPHDSIVPDDVRQARDATL
jgi:hypothetical protein